MKTHSLKIYIKANRMFRSWMEQLRTRISELVCKVISARENHLSSVLGHADTTMLTNRDDIQRKWTSETGNDCTWGCNSSGVHCYLVNWPVLLNCGFILSPWPVLMKTVWPSHPLLSLWLLCFRLTRDISKKILFQCFCSFKMACQHSKMLFFFMGSHKHYSVILDPSSEVQAFQEVPDVEGKSWRKKKKKALLI